MSKNKLKLSGFIVVVFAFALALCGCHHAEDLASYDFNDRPVVEYEGASI